MRNPKVIAALVLAVLVLIVILQNTETVQTRLLFMTVSMPRAALLGVTLLIGFGVGVLTAHLRRRSG